MSNVQVPDVKVSVLVAGGEVAIFSFWKVALSPQEWELTAAILDESTRRAVRSILLQCASELTNEGWSDLSSLYQESVEDGNGESDSEIGSPFA